MQEEEARAQKLKEETAANVEFEKWKGAFSVETEGTLAEEEAKVEGLLNDFVDYIKVIASGGDELLGFLAYFVALMLQKW